MLMVACCVQLVPHYFYLIDGSVPFDQCFTVPETRLRNELLLFVGWYVKSYSASAVSEFGSKVIEHFYVVTVNYLCLSSMDMYCRLCAKQVVKPDNRMRLDVFLTANDIHLLLSVSTPHTSVLLLMK